MAIEDAGVSYDGYKLRMSIGSWYLNLFIGDADSGKRFGPFTYLEALKVAKDYALKDVERGLVQGDRP